MLLAGMTAGDKLRVDPREADGFHTSDGDTGIYFRPETGNSILIGSETQRVLTHTKIPVIVYR